MHSFGAPGGTLACRSPATGLDCFQSEIQNGKDMNWFPYAAMAAGLMALFFMGLGYIWVKIDKDDPEDDES